MSFQDLGSGHISEYLVSSVFQGEDYLTRTSIPLKINNSNTYITDVDVFGIKFTKPFQISKVICDCKDRAKSKPFERIFWVKGISDYLGINEAYISLPKANYDIFKYAKRGQVKVLTSDILKDSKLRLYGKEKKPFGLSDYESYSKIYRDNLSTFKKQKKAAEILQLSRSLFLSDEPYTTINTVIFELEKCVKFINQLNRNQKSEYVIWKYIICDLIVVFTLHLLYIISDTIGLNKNERHTHIRERLTFGDSDPVKANEIFNLANRLAYETVRGSAVSSQLDLSFNSIQIDSPDYTEDIIGLVERALLNPEYYHSLPLLMDYLLFEHAIKNEKFSYSKYEKDFQNDLILEEKLKAARNIFSFIRDTVKLNMKLIWNKDDNDLPKK